MSTTDSISTWIAYEKLIGAKMPKPLTLKTMAKKKPDHNDIIWLTQGEYAQYGALLGPGYSAGPYSYRGHSVQQLP